MKGSWAEDHMMIMLRRFRPINGHRAIPACPIQALAAAVYRTIRRDRGSASLSVAMRTNTELSMPNLFFARQIDFDGKPYDRAFWTITSISYRQELRKNIHVDNRETGLLPVKLGR